MSNKYNGGFSIKEQLNGDHWDKIDALAIITWRFSIISYILTLILTLLIAMISAINFKKMNNLAIYSDKRKIIETNDR